MSDSINGKNKGPKPDAVKQVAEFRKKLREETLEKAEIRSASMSGKPKQADEEVWYFNPTDQAVEVHPGHYNWRVEKFVLKEDYDTVLSELTATKSQCDALADCLRTKCMCWPKDDSRASRNPCEVCRVITEYRSFTRNEKPGGS